MKQNNLISLFFLFLPQIVLAADPQMLTPTAPQALTEPSSAAPSPDLSPPTVPQGATPPLSIAPVSISPHIGDLSSAPPESLPAPTLNNNRTISSTIPSSIPSSSPLSTPPSTQTEKVVSPEYAFDHLENTAVFFKTPANSSSVTSIKTGIYDLNYLGSLRSTEGGVPYFLFTGKPCQSCLDDKAIYVIRPNGEKPNSYVFPGRVIDPKHRALVLESRAFFGKCLVGKGDAYVVFQKEKVDRKRSLQTSVLVAEAAKNHLQENLLERRLPSIKNTLQLVKKGHCHEVEGRNRMMVKIPLDLHPQGNSDDDDEELETDKKSVETKSES